jgi:hypothetical protein
MRLNNASDGGETQPLSVGFGGEELIEDPAASLRAHAAARVLNPQADVIDGWRIAKMVGIISWSYAHSPSGHSDGPQLAD